MLGGFVPPFTGKDHLLNQTGPPLCSREHVHAVAKGVIATCRVRVRKRGRAPGVAVGSHTTCCLDAVDAVHAPIIFRNP